MRFVCVASVLLFLLPAGTADGVTFERVFGGPARDHAASVEQTRDGGYILLGQAPSLDADPCFLKTDPLGNTLWIRKLEVSCEQYSGFSVIQTTDGGYAAALSCWCCPRQTRILVVKTDALGRKLWSAAYGKTGRDYAWGAAIYETRDGGYILTGGTGLAPYLVKLNSGGEPVWERTYSLRQENPCRSVREIKSGGYITAGGRHDMLLMRVGENGDMVWARNYGGPERDEAYWVEPAWDGGYVITGYTESFGAGSKDVYLVRTDSSGRATWARTYGTTSDEVGYSVQSTRDGGYIIVGTAGAVGAEDSDAYLVKTDSVGLPLWTRTYGGPMAEKAFSVKETEDGGYVLAGYTASCGSGDFDAYLVKTDSLGLLTGPQDVAPLRVKSPGEEVRMGAECAVIGEVRNLSNRCLSYRAVATVEGVYSDTVEVAGHAPGTSLEVVFDGWMPEGERPASFTLTIYTDLQGDTDPTNDFIQRQITVR